MPNPERAKPRSMANLPSFLRHSSDRKEDAAVQAADVGSQQTEQQLRLGQDTASLPTPSRSLVHRYENFWGRRVSISIDGASKAIHFENCYRRRWAFKFFPEEHAYCSISDVRSYFADHAPKNDCTWIIIKTLTGTARVRFDDADDDGSECSAFSDFYNAIHHLFAFKERRFHTGSSWAMTLYLLSAIFGFFVGQPLIMSNGAGALVSSLGILLVIAPIVATYLFVDFLDRR
jgi:hypothetical protein